MAKCICSRLQNVLVSSFVIQYCKFNIVCFVFIQIDKWSVLLAHLWTAFQSCFESSSYIFHQWLFWEHILHNTMGFYFKNNSYIFHQGFFMRTTLTFSIRDAKQSENGVLADRCGVADYRQLCDKSMMKIRNQYYWWWRWQCFVN